MPVFCPRSSMDVKVYVAGTAVSMCNCKNVWLKSLNDQVGTLDISPTCGSATTTKELLEACQNQLQTLCKCGNESYAYFSLGGTTVF